MGRGGYGDTVIVKGEDIMSYNFWKGEKIGLRAVELKDAENYYKWFYDYDCEADRYCDEIHFPRNCEAMNDMVEKKSKAAPENDEFTWIIENSDGIAVGNINTINCNSRIGTFGYGLGISREYWGKGYAKEAIKIILRYYFRELRYQKATVYVYSFNERSMKLHEALGFKKEGVIRRMVYTNGNYYDEVIYGMTSGEFDEIDEKLELC
ncbi:GNAT family N-acetyltransferase [Clostridium sp. Marseille-Q7071]